jgi:hypothetical protein
MACCELGEDQEIPSSHSAPCPLKHLSTVLKAPTYHPPRYIDILTHATVLTGGSVPGSSLSNRSEASQKAGERYIFEPAQCPFHDDLSHLWSLPASRRDESMQRVLQPDSVVLQCSASKRRLVGAQGALQENKEGEAAGRERCLIHPGPTSSCDTITRRE